MEDVVCSCGNDDLELCGNVVKGYKYICDEVYLLCADVYYCYDCDETFSVEYLKYDCEFCE